MRTLGGDPHFSYVNNGDAEFGQRDFDALRAHRYLLSDTVTPERFSADGMHTALAARVRSLASGAGLFEKTLLPEDPTGETLHLVDRLTPATQPRRVHGAWFDAGGANALLLAETRAAGSDLEGQAEAIAILERALATVKGDHDVLLRYSSPGAMAAQSRALISADASRLAMVSTVLIIALLAFVYRSAVVVLLCALPALTGLLVGIATIDVAFGGVHAITLGFGATLLGEAVDYPGYLLTQMRRDETAPAALARLARTLAMAVLTTVAAASALLLADFPGLAQLGLLTMVGVLGAGIVTAWVLPYWVPPRWHPVPARARAWLWRRMPSPRAGFALAAVLVAGVARIGVRQAVVGRRSREHESAARRTEAARSRAARRARRAGGALHAAGRGRDAGRRPRRRGAAAAGARTRGVVARARRLRARQRLPAVACHAAAAPGGLAGRGRAPRAIRRGGERTAGARRGVRAVLRRRRKRARAQRRSMREASPERRSD